VSFQSFFWSSSAKYRHNKRLENDFRFLTKGNIVTCTEILAGLILEKDVVRRLLREEIMCRSVIYQAILQQGIEQVAINLLLRSSSNESGTGGTSDRFISRVNTKTAKRYFLR
jgi:hypothetical protein